MHIDRRCKHPIELWSILGRVVPPDHHYHHHRQKKRNWHELPLRDTVEAVVPDVDRPSLEIHERLLPDICNLADALEKFGIVPVDC